MILSVEKLKEFITTDVSDQVLEARLSALETSIRKKTNNNFQDRRFRTVGEVSDGILTVLNPRFFSIGDTIMVNEDLCVIENITSNMIITDKNLLDSKNVLVTKIVYPNDIIVGVANVMEWTLANPSSKAGISSETLSRHSVSYQGSSEFDSELGCPIRLLSFLNQYTKARF